MRKRSPVGIGVILLGWAGAAGAADWTAAAEVGFAPRYDVYLGRISVNAPLPRSWSAPLESVALRWEVSVSRIAAAVQDEVPNKDLTSVAGRALVRYQPETLGPVFLEAGSGPVWQTDLWIGEVNMGYRIQFRSHAGVGVMLGNEWRLRYRYAHTSNAHLGEPNPGLNTHEVGLARQL